jgi:hypothetical protein
MAGTPIFAGIDLSSDERKCAFAEGGPRADPGGTPTLAVSRVWVRRQDADPGSDRTPGDRRATGWGLGPVQEYLTGLVARCEKDDRVAVVAVDVPFGYPDRFRRYIENPLERVADATDAGSNPVDLHLYRGCELRLIDHLRPGGQPARSPASPHRALWDYYTRLRAEYPTAGDEPQSSRGWTTRPFSPVGSWLASTTVRWVRLCSDLGAAVAAPSVWRLGTRVFLFECYPTATQVFSGLWHPRLKAKRADDVTRRAAAGLLVAGRVQLDNGGAAPADLRPWWGCIDLGGRDVTSTDHQFDALTGLLTAWWLGKHLGAGGGDAGITDYPSPARVRLHPAAVNAVTGSSDDDASRLREGVIYYPAVPEPFLTPPGGSSTTRSS